MRMMINRFDAQATLHGLILVGCLAAGFGCNADEVVYDESQSENQSSILNGTPSFDPRVAILFIHAPDSADGFICTSFLVGSNADQVMTAAHCVDPREVGDGNVFDVYFATELPDDDESLLSAAGGIRVTSDRVHENELFDPSNFPGGHDMAILDLGQSISTAPFQLRRERLTNNLIGERVIDIGYGDNRRNDTGAGIQRRGRATLRSFNAQLVRTSARTCSGDSGGPNFIQRQGEDIVISVTSFGRGCGFPDKNARIDTNGEFLDSFLH